MPEKRKKAHAGEQPEAVQQTVETAAAETAPAPDETKQPDDSTALLSVAEEEVKRLKALVEELEEQVRQKEKQIEEEHNQYLRVLAEFKNFRRRSEDQGKEQIQFANRELIIGLLPLLDNFERAIAAAEKNQSFEALIGGVMLTLRQFQDYLKKHGVEPIEAVGKEFDPNLHEAVSRVEDGDAPDNTVVEEFQRGYMMRERVLRPAMVKVKMG
jgi:molecular chaperone GrpE